MWGSTSTIAPQSLSIQQRPAEEKVQVKASHFNCLKKNYIGLTRWRRWSSRVHRSHTGKREKEKRGRWYYYCLPPRQTKQTLGLVASSIGSPKSLKILKYVFFFSSSPHGILVRIQLSPLEEFKVLHNPRKAK
jgi:hypothetical protein